MQSSNPRDPASHPQLFLSYAIHDRKLVLDFRAALDSAGLGLRVFFDQDLQAGKDWRSELQRQLEASALVMFMLSPASLASDYIRSIEVPTALKGAEARGVRIVPVLLSDCDWQHSPLARFQILPRSLRPVSNYRPRSRGFHEVIDGLRELLDTQGHVAAAGSLQAAAPPPLPAGTDRLRVAAYALQLQGGDPTAIERLDPAELGSFWARHAAGHREAAQVFESLAGRHGVHEPHPLWSAWVETVMPDKLGT